MSAAGPGKSGEDIWQLRINPWIIAAIMFAGSFFLKRNEPGKRGKF
jgi:hypothetical protein